MSASTPLCQGAAAGADRRWPVIVYGLPGANYTRGAVCAGPAPFSEAPSPPSSRAWVSIEPLKLWGLPQVAPEPCAFLSSRWEKARLLNGFCEICQDCCGGQLQLPNDCTWMNSPRCWPWQESSHACHLTQACRGQRPQHQPQTMGRPTHTHAPFPRISEPLNERGSKPSLKWREGSHKNSRAIGIKAVLIWGIFNRSSHFLSLGTKTRILWNLACSYAHNR